jgi:maltooligosyltrehalose trehalohydrolase
MPSHNAQSALGAIVRDNAVQFRLWAPKASTVSLVLYPDERTVPMAHVGDGYYEATVPGARHGTTYRYLIDDRFLIPDPVSRYQPEGVHGPSMVVDPTRYRWRDVEWQGVPREDLIFYELHVGTFTPEGTFDGVRERLPYLKDLGITAIELMPVADFPGRWNWGYDPAAFFAPSRAYGEPDDLRRLVDDAHGLGMAVYLDVIYNHLGPDGSYVAALAPMFTDKHLTPWGQAINLDDTGSEGVRRFFIENALYWLREYHIDGLRLDATHALIDTSKTHFLAELVDAVAELSEGPRRILFAEDQRNINHMILPREKGGMGLDGIWTDDFHHQVRNLTAGDRDGYFASFEGTTADHLAKTVRQGWFFDGVYDPVTQEVRGSDASVIDPSQCVIFIQNHDQVGNRPLGNRLTADIPLPLYRAVSALLLFAPELPLLFMGQEWAATTPFLFFTDHNEELGKLVSAGRKAEFGHFEGFKGEVPDPQDPDTFYQSRLDWSELEIPIHAATLQLYRDLIRIRREIKGGATVEAFNETALSVRRGNFSLLVNLGQKLSVPLPIDAEVLLDTESERYAPDGHPPTLTEGELQFHTPGALLFRTK